jgi:hypothetical protein
MLFNLCFLIHIINTGTLVLLDFTMTKIILANIHIYLDIGFVGVHPNYNKEQDNMERISDDICFSIYAF